MRIKEIRIAKGTSQRKAAIDLGLSPVVYGRYENEIRKPEPEMLAIIADYLGVTVDELIGRSEAPTDAEKEPVTYGGLDAEFIQLLSDLPPDEIAQLRAFLAGMKAKRTT